MSTSVETVDSQKKPDYQLANGLTSDLTGLRKKTEKIGTWNIFTTRGRLKAIENEREELDKKTDKLFASCQRVLTESPIYLSVDPLESSIDQMGRMTQLVEASRVGGLTVLAVLRAQEASQSLGALIERKYAYFIGWASLYIAILSLILAIPSLYYAVHPPDTKPSEPPAQAFFQVPGSIQFPLPDAAIRSADLDERLPKGTLPFDLTASVCTAKSKLGAAGSDVAFVVGRHDQRPLNRAGQLKFSTNAGLAQQRAEAVAKILAEENQCGKAVKTVVTLIAAPRHVGKGMNSPDLLQEDRDVTIFGWGTPK